MSKKKVSWPKGESFQFITDGHPSESFQFITDGHPSGHKEFPSISYQKHLQGVLGQLLAIHMGNKIWGLPCIFFNFISKRNPWQSLNISFCFIIGVFSKPNNNENV
jgi:hypothetical protein